MLSPNRAAGSDGPPVTARQPLPTPALVGAKRLEAVMGVGLVDVAASNATTASRLIPPATSSPRPRTGWPHYLPIAARLWRLPDPPEPASPVGGLPGRRPGEPDSPARHLEDLMHLSDMHDRAAHFCSPPVPNEASAAST